MLWIVAGCLFEVSLPLTGGPWRWANPTSAVTILGEEDRGDVRHVRFRAEAPGLVELTFVGERQPVPVPVTVTVRIAPERLA